MSNIGHALVIDDKYDDGMLVCAALIKNSTPCYFLQYDEEQILQRLEENTPKISGIRVIFQDLALTSISAPSKNDYEAAVTAIEAIVAENNGPWLLVTWSTWAGSESNLGDKNAKEMYDHLKQNLRASQQPYAYVVLDTKPKYTIAGAHSEVKKLGDITVQERQNLVEHITTKTKKSPATNALLSWEADVFKAISETISEITNFIKPGEYFDSDLGSILKELALADIGKNLSPHNIKKGIREVLSTILKDKIGLTIEGLENFENINTVQEERLENWKAKTNRILHFEESVLVTPFPPGTIFDLTDHITLLPGAFEKKELFEKFIRSNFFQLPKEDKNKKQEITEQCMPIALDITPPCDHAQNKSPWSKYIIGIKIPTHLVKYCHTKDSAGNPGRLIGDYLLKLPHMTNISGDFCFIFNSKLTFSLDTEQANNIFIKNTLGRLREQILNDLNSWLIRQTTRPGIIELR